MIRRAEPSDARVIFTLWRGLIEHEVSTIAGVPYPGIMGEEESFPIWEHEFLLGLEQAATMFLVDEIDSKITGYVVGYLNRRSFGLPHNFMEVAEIYVDPAYRKGSTALRLLRAIERAAKKVGLDYMECTCLTTDKQTQQAIRAGWKPYLARFYKAVR